MSETKNREVYADWITRFYASHDDIPDGRIDGELISKLIRCLRNDPLFEFIEQFGVTGVIDAQPTVDAEPVRHGKWVDEGYYADNTNVKAWHCSECSWHMLGYDDELFGYCPMCGARMDEDETN